MHIVLSRRNIHIHVYFCWQKWTSTNKRWPFLLAKMNMHKPVYRSASKSNHVYPKLSIFAGKNEHTHTALHSCYRMELCSHAVHFCWQKWTSANHFIRSWLWNNHAHNSLLKGYIYFSWKKVSIHIKLNPGMVTNIYPSGGIILHIVLSIHIHFVFFCWQNWTSSNRYIRSRKKSVFFPKEFIPMLSIFAG